jgi:hypothetical protein
MTECGAGSSRRKEAGRDCSRASCDIFRRERVTLRRRCCSVLSAGSAQNYPRRISLTLPPLFPAHPGHGYPSSSWTVIRRQSATRSHPAMRGSGDGPVAVTAGSRVGSGTRPGRVCRICRRRSPQFGSLAVAHCLQAFGRITPRGARPNKATGPGIAEEMPACQAESCGMLHSDLV